MLNFFKISLERIILKDQTNCPGGGIGRHKGLKIPRRQLRAGSSPAPGTNIYYESRLFVLTLVISYSLIYVSKNVIILHQG